MPVQLEPAAKTIQTDSKKHKAKADEPKYKDPLNSWAISALTYSSEIGATVNEIAPKLTFALWVPSFMYLGADIYDKYKNDKNEYSPSSKRAVKESIRQALTFFILPSAATIIGQKLTSPIGKLISGKISINARDSIYRHTNSAIEQATEENFRTKENFKEFLNKSVENHIQELENDRKQGNILKKAYRYLTGYFALADTDSAKVHAYITTNAEKIFEIKEKLKQGITDKSIPTSVTEKYKNTLKNAKQLFGQDQTNMALKNALQNYQNHLIVKNKILKTLGGVASCLLFTQPIGYLVNKILMPQYITPGINLINEKLNDSNLLKIHLNKLNDINARQSIFSNGSGKSLKILQPSELLHRHKNAQADPEHTIRQDT